MNKESPEQSTTAQKFWDAFKACAEDNRVRAFDNFQPGKRLRNRSRQDIEAFLADLGNGPASKNGR